MVEGFFFDGIDIRRNDLAIDQGVEGTFPVLSHTANPEPRFRNDAFMGTQMTLNLLLIEPFPQTGFLNHVGASLFLF